MAIVTLETSSVGTLIVTGSVVFDAGATATVLDVTATPVGGGTVINMGSILNAGTFDFSAVVPTGTYDVVAVASETVQNIITQTATQAV
jgi:hypothetical protein